MLRTGASRPAWFEEVVAPVVAFIDADKAMRERLDTAFPEWLLEPGAPPTLIGVTPAEPCSDEYRAAEDLLEQLRRSLPDELADALDYREILNSCIATES